MLAAAFFVVTMIIFMMRTSRRLKGDIEGKVQSLAERSSALGLFMFVFLMVLREGVETVAVLFSVSLTTSELLSFMGTVMGLLLAIAFGVIFVKGSIRINLQKFFRFTTVILFFVAGQLLISGLHELGENGVLPSSQREMALIGPIVRNEFFFVVTILALAGMMILFDYRRRVPEALPESAAERRKAQWTARRERLWMSLVYASSFVFILLITAQFIYAKSTATLSPATPVTFVNGTAVIPVSQVADGDLHRYSATLDGTVVRFWLVKKPDGKVATLFDACEICGPVGFYKNGNHIVCKNCAAPINPQSVGQPGGCNPVPLKATVEGDNVVIAQSDLAEGERLFKSKQ
jgi:uncharacterized membrane protein